MIEKNKGGRGKFSAERNAEVVAARESGMTYPEMGAKFGVSRNRLVMIIKRAQQYAMGLDK
jgi:Mor family transcriptional regulator